MYRLNLLELIKLMDNEFVNEEYIRYLIHDSKYKYRDREIESIRDLISSLNMDNIYLNGFVYSYKIPALDKEFDLIKIFKDSILNIELKYKKLAL